MAAAPSVPSLLDLRKAPSYLNRYQTSLLVSAEAAAEALTARQSDKRAPAFDANLNTKGSFAHDPTLVNHPWADHWRRFGGAPSGSSWVPLATRPKTGREITDTKLSAALKKRSKFSSKALTRLKSALRGNGALRHDDYVDATVEGEAARFLLPAPSLESYLSTDHELGAAPIRLVDARFLIALADVDGSILPRRQDLETAAEAAFLPVDLLRQLHQGFGTSLRVICVSHCWLQPDHPDPRGDNLRLLARVLRMFVESAIPCPGTYGVFFDYCSMHQKPLGGGERTDTERRLFERALDSMHEWFSHASTFVLQLTKLPEGYPTIGFEFEPGDTVNQANYWDRG